MRVTFRCSCRLQETLNERNAPIAIRNGETKDNAQLGHSNATKNYGLTKGIAYRSITGHFDRGTSHQLTPFERAAPLTLAGRFEPPLILDTWQTAQLIQH